MQNAPSLGSFLPSADPQRARCSGLWLPMFSRSTSSTSPSFQSHAVGSACPAPASPATPAATGSALPACTPIPTPQMLPAQHPAAFSPQSCLLPTKGCSSGARWGSQPVPKVLAQYVPPQRDSLYQQFCQRCSLLMALLSVDLIYVTHSFTGIRGCDNKSSSLRRLRRSLFLRNVFSFTHQIFDK